MKRGAGRPRGSAWQYAMELGIPYKKLVRLGGEERVRAMSDDARAILLKPGQAARKMVKGVPGIRSQAERVA